MKRKLLRIQIFNKLLVQFLINVHGGYSSVCMRVSMCVRLYGVHAHARVCVRVYVFFIVCLYCYVMVF